MDNLDKRMMQTPDLNKERLEKLKNFFPDIFTVEGKLNPDELKKIIDPELVKEAERFEFKWFGKSEAKRTAFTPSKATLIYDEARSVNPDDADGNMIIEGENLELLKVLLSAYRERIKCIYIDPPYNVDGDFVYNDNWDESKEDYWEHIGVTENGVQIDTNSEASGRFHSNWMNMMYPRLLLARQLLKEDGVIFISIDDNEIHNLRKICDEIFGESNFEGHIHWRRRHNQPNDKTKMIGLVAEHIISYSKNKEAYKQSGVGKVDITGKFSNPNNDPRGDWASKPWKVGSDQSGSRYKIINPNNNAVYDEEWMGDEQTYQQLLADNRIVFPRNGEGLPRKKYYKYEREEEGQCATNWWSHQEFGHNQGANDEMTALFDGIKNIFSNPKPKELIRGLIQIANVKENNIVLDFFAGSGTTAHAIMELNKEDGGNRKFILIQLPEKIDKKSEAYKADYKKISDITIERNKRVIEKIEKEEKEKNPDLFTDGQKPFKTGFKVYKLAKSNFPRVDFAPDPTKSEKENLALLDKYIQEKEAMYLALIDEKNIFDEALLKNGFMLNYKLEQINGFTKNKVFHAKDDFKECLICMEMNIAKETLKELEKYKDKIFICLERSLDTTTKWNLKHLLGDKLIAF
ncbi:MAG: site-specific DNA-methyltransferase [Actinobacteria bacterium]|nr:site-specific DNA-methyltransferase [Actinomycetota bacterium]